MISLIEFFSGRSDDGGRGNHESGNGVFAWIFVKRRFSNGDNGDSMCLAEYVPNDGWYITGSEDPINEGGHDPVVTIKVVQRLSMPADPTEG